MRLVRRCNVQWTRQRNSLMILLSDSFSSIPQIDKLQDPDAGKIVDFDTNTDLGKKCMYKKFSATLNLLEILF